MKGIVLTSLLLCIFSLTSAQKKIVKTDRDDAGSLYALVSTLYDYQDVYHEVYTGTSAWIYLVTAELSKRKLTHTIQVNYPEVKLALDSRIKSLKDKTSIEPLDPTFKDVYSMIELSTALTQRLLTFEDYESDSNLIAVRTAFRAELEPLYNRIDEAFQKQFLIIRNEFKTALPLLSPKMPAARLEETKYYVNRWETLNKTKETGRNVYKGILNWIYTPDDSISKIKLQKDLIDMMSLRESLVMDSIGYFGMESLAIQELDATLDTLHWNCRETMDMLAAPEHYEDAMTILLCEDRVETIIRPLQNRARQIFDFMDESEKANLELLLADPEATKTLRKQQDIRRMLDNSEGGVMTILSTSQQKLKTNPLYERVVKKIKTKDVMEGLVPIYDRLFTHEEIKEIIKFQNSAAGKKMREHSLEIQVGIIQFINSYLQRLVEEEEKLESK